MIMNGRIYNQNYKNIQKFMKLMDGKFSFMLTHISPHIKTLNTNANEIEQYDLTYENNSRIKTPKKIKTPICS
jgi:hypothetical protein